jgi:hypothetical protein
MAFRVVRAPVGVTTAAAAATGDGDVLVLSVVTRRQKDGVCRSCRSVYKTKQANGRVYRGELVYEPSVEWGEYVPSPPA